MPFMKQARLQTLFKQECMDSVELGITDDERSSMPMKMQMITNRKDQVLIENR
jgi:hypothetical protein